LQDVPNTAVPDGKYTIVQVGQGTGGGIMQQVPHGPLGWLAYIEVKQIREATKKAQTLGAKVMKDVTEVPDMGWLSILEDPTGAVFGLWQSK